MYRVRPTALAGVMGGALAVRDDTDALWLEIASFDHVDVRRISPLVSSSAPDATSANVPREALKFFRTSMELTLAY